MKKKIIAAFICLCMGASALAGCGSSPAATENTAPAVQESQEQTKPAEESKAQETAAKDSGAGEQEPVELTLWVTSRNSDDWSTEMENKFLEEHPWITLNKVVKEGDPGNEFYQAVAAGTAPDLVNCSFTMMNSFMAAGILEPLNQYTDSWDEWGNFTKEYTDMFTKDGNVYGLPVSVAPMLFGYNKALFKEAGISEPPKTWDEAIEDAKLINNPDNQITGYATLAAEWTEWFFQYYVWQAGGDLTKENEDGTAELTFTDPAVIEAAKYYQRLRSEGVLQSDLTLKFSDLVTNFGLGKIGMMPFAGDWVSEAAANGIDPVSYTHLTPLPDDMYTADAYEARLFEETSKLTDYFYPEYLPKNLYMDKDDYERFSSIQTSLQEYVKTSVVQFITGELSLENDWDSYVSQLNNYDTETYLSLYQKAYDDYNAN